MTTLEKPVTPVLWAALNDRQGPHAEALANRLALVLDAAAWSYLNGTLSCALATGKVLEFTLDLSHPDAHWNLDLDECTPSNLKPRLIWARSTPHTDPVRAAMAERIRAITIDTLKSYPWM